MEIELGDYEMVGMHRDCEHGGRVMRCSLMKINGKNYPSGEEISESYWCNGLRSIWVRRARSAADGGDGEYWCNGRTWDRKQKVWLICKCRTGDGDILQIDPLSK